MYPDADLGTYKKVDFDEHQKNVFECSKESSEGGICPFMNVPINAPSVIDSSVVTYYCSVADLDDLPADMQKLLRGVKEHLPDDVNPPPLPSWLDIEKLKRGQLFALKYLYGVNFSQAMSLFFLFASPDGIKPLIFTEKSHTPSLAEKRYLSTSSRVQSWYETDICDEKSLGYRNLKSVRALHLSVSKRMNRMSHEEIRQRTNLEEKVNKDGKAGMLCPLLSTLKKDFQTKEHFYPMMTANTERVYLNQVEMAVTQFGFFGLVLLHPEKFGAKGATREELESFVHLWRYVGYMLGLDDQYNLCSGSLQEVMERSRHLEEYFIKPGLMGVNKEWEHMSRSAIQGIEKFTKMKMNFEASILYLYWIMGVQTTNLVQCLSWKEYMMFNFHKFFMTEAYKIPGFAKLANYTVRKRLQNAEREHKLQQRLNK